MKTKLYFDIKDKEYFDRLSQYITANYGMYFEITDSVENESPVCIVSDYINKRNKRGIFLVKEENGDVSKYCSASEICSALMEFNDFGAENCALKSKKGPLSVCVISAAGGAGKSVIAQALCCSYALKGKKVLYINLNPFSTHEQVFVDKEKNAYTRLRFYIRKMSGDISTLLKRVACTDAKRRIDYIINENPSADGFIKTDEASWFMAEINKGCCYDVILFDMSSYPGEGQIEIMKKAGRTFLVCKKNPDEKHNAFRRFLVLAGVDNIIDVSNFSEDGKNRIPEAEGIFTQTPLKFWSAIDDLCKFTEVKDDISS